MTSVTGHYMKTSFAQVVSRLVEAWNGETEKKAEPTDQMLRLHDRFG